MIETRTDQIEILAGDGRLDDLKETLGSNFSQLQIDIALGIAIAYSRIETAEFLLSLGADISHYNYQGAYYAAHNNELGGVKFAVTNGVDINVNGGMLIGESVITAHNQKDARILRWLLENGADLRKISRENRKTIEAFRTNEITSIFEAHNKSC